MDNTGKQLGIFLATIGALGTIAHSATPEGEKDNQAHGKFLNGIISIATIAYIVDILRK